MVKCSYLFMRKRGIRLSNEKKTRIRMLAEADFSSLPDCTNADGALAQLGLLRREGSARCSVEHGRLHIENRSDGACETFFDIPALADMTDQSYAIQYDITHLFPQSESYVSSAAFVTSCHEELSAYVELPVRVKGRTGHDICIGSSRMTLATPGMHSPSMHGRAPGQTALVEKLLPDGSYDSAQANLPYLKDKTVVVRLYHDACGDETVYMLVPSACGGRGEWALVSRTARRAAGAPYRLLGLLGGAIKLRVTPGANLLMGGFRCWEGDGPLEDGYPPLQRERFSEPSGGPWLLDALPPYVGGKLSQRLYEDSVGYHHLFAGDSRMQLVYDTSVEEFERYAEVLRAWGASLSEAARDARLISYRFRAANASGYLYHSVLRRETRIITDETPESCLPEDFGYSYAKRADEHTRLYIYGLHMDPNGLNLCDNNNTASNCGMFLILKLADDGVMIIDGGGHPQMNEVAGRELDRFLHEITHTPENGRVRIANWFITHDHGDHFNGFARFLLNYHDRYDLERVMFHLCAIHLPPNIKRIFGELIPSWYPSVKYYKPHTGETVRLSDASIEVLYTPEDGVNAPDATYASGDGNDNSTCLSIRFDGSRALVIGDAYFHAAGVLLCNCTEEKLRSDIVQISHHGLNDLGVLYSHAGASLALYPQHPTGALRANNNHGATVYNNIVKYLKRGAEGICFSGAGTYGIEMLQGEPTVVHTLPVVGRKYGGWDTFDLFSEPEAGDNNVHN